MPTPEEIGLPNTFNLQRFQDIHLQDQDLLKEYISQYQSGAINTAHQIIETNPQGIGKTFTAKTLNAYTKAKRLQILNYMFYVRQLENNTRAYEIFEYK